MRVYNPQIVLPCFGYLAANYARRKPISSMTHASKNLARGVRLAVAIYAATKLEWQIRTTYGYSVVGHFGLPDVVACVEDWSELHWPNSHVVDSFDEALSIVNTAVRDCKERHWDAYDRGGYFRPYVASVFEVEQGSDGLYHKVKLVQAFDIMPGRERLPETPLNNPRAAHPQLRDNEMRMEITPMELVGAVNGATRRLMNKAVRCTPSVPREKNRPAAKMPLSLKGVQPDLEDHLGREPIVQVPAKLQWKYDRKPYRPTKRRSWKGNRQVQFH